jgi:hypothetical protein
VYILKLFSLSCAGVPVNADAGRAEIWGLLKQMSLNDQRADPCRGITTFNATVVIELHFSDS